MREKLCLFFVLLLLLPAATGLAARQTPQTPKTPKISGILEIYLARHGQTDWNAAHRLQGSADIPLNSTGRIQAAQLARRLADVHFDAVYSSALVRSRATAEIVRGGVPLTIVAGLNERRLGTFEGRSTDGSDPAAAQSYLTRSQDPGDDLDGGESLTVFFNRVRAALEQILSQHPSGTILIVGHGATNQMIVRSLLRLSPSQAAAFQQANDDLYLIQVDAAHHARAWKLVAFDP
ncbi:MAG TPA: histidine phosphatase family protein [Vicinamibacterales bacterium]|jgi:broad specificity phosphatase PhoE|nr:histidine phosphatase family protein [Vicinamibacterales bacterium]